MKKEEWVNEILESASAIKEVQENPFLYQKMLNRLNRRKEPGISISRFRLGWAVAIALIISVNAAAFFTYRHKVQKQNELVVLETLSSQMISNSTFNY